MVSTPTSFFIALDLIIVFTCDTAHAQKTVYKAKYVINDPYWKVKPKFLKAEAESFSVVRFGPENRIRYEGKEHAAEYHVLDFTRGEDFPFFANGKLMMGGMGEHTENPEFLPPISQIKETKPPVLLGDTVIQGYKCHIYKATCIAGPDKGKPSETSSITWTYYVTEDLKYPYDYSVKNENLYLPNVPVKGFLLRASKMLKGMDKKIKDPPPVEYYFYYTDLSFDPIPDSDTDIPKRFK